MGMVLRFTPQSRRKPMPPPATPGRVVMFTGVRYQRHDPEPEKPMPRQKRKL